MTKSEKKVLKDMGDFIKYSLQIGRDFRQTLATIGHDVNGILTYGSLEQMEEDFFLPRTNDYAKKVKRMKERSKV